MASDKEFDVALNMEMSMISDFNNSKKSGLAALHFGLRTYLAEFLGSLLLVLFGDGVIAQVIFNKASKGSSFLSINLGWAIGLGLAVLVAGPVSGAHLNPAVTLASALLKKFPWNKVPGYMLSQLLGSFVGAMLVYILYLPAINDFDGGVRQTVGDFATAGIFSTFPYAGAPLYNSFISETLCTGVLVLLILSVSDPRHKIPSYVAAASIGAIVASIGLSIGMMSGYSMNPARDLGPRLFTSIAGWGWEPFTAANNYFWVPLTAPFVGAFLGMVFYDVLIHPDES